MALLFFFNKENKNTTTSNPAPGKTMHKLNATKTKESVIKSKNPWANSTVVKQRQLVRKVL